jgi:hypothetical protein
MRLDSNRSDLVKVDIEVEQPVHGQTTPRWMQGITGLNLSVLPGTDGTPPACPASRYRGAAYARRVS